MPHAWVTVMPWRAWKPSIIEAGAAEPPITIERIDVRSQRFASSSRSARMPSQIVGTPAARVTFSADIRSSSDPGARCGPGKTIFAPDATAANGRPHAFAWNIGTTGRTASPSLTASVSARQTPSVCSTMARWLESTPFGLPVVPEV